MLTGGSMNLFYLDNHTWTNGRVSCRQTYCKNAIGSCPDTVYSRLGRCAQIFVARHE